MLNDEAMFIISTFKNDKSLLSFFSVCAQNNTTIKHIVCSNV